MNVSSLRKIPISMGSSTIIDNIPTMAEDKKNPLKCLLKNIKCKLGIKKEKEHDTKENKKDINNKQKEIKNNKTKHTKPEIIVEDVIENFRKLEIEKKKESQKKEEEDELKNFSFKPVVDNEHENFTYKVVEEDRSRTESIQSQDSGFSEKSDEISKEDDDVIKAEEDHTKENKELESVEESKKEDKLTKEEDEVLESLQNLNIDGKKKKAQLVPVARGPVRHKVGDISGTYHPYGIDTHINTTINKHTFSGGQVIVAQRSQEFVEQVPFKNDPTDELQTFSDDLASRGVQLNGLPFDLDLVQEYLDENNQENILQEFLNDPNCDEHLNTITNLVDKHIGQFVEEPAEQQNPIEELENTNHLNFEKIETLDSMLGFQEDNPYTNMFPTPPSAETAHSPSNTEFYSNFLTPPRSETIPSPMSDSLYPTSSDCVLSPNSDCEIYQNISYYDEFPAIPEDIKNSPESDVDKKARERNTSTSSLSMKNFKDLQKELAATFSKKECCQINRKPCRELFQEHMKKLKAEERRSICLQVSSMDLKTIYGVLHHILIEMSRGEVDEDLHMSLFALLCEKVLGTKPQLFTEDFGLSLLKAASLRCASRPLLTRYLVQCVRTAVRHNPAGAEGKEYLFKEVDALGDTLVTACARGGDAYADVLAELVRRERHEKPLFNVQHGNTEGYSALHVACREHGAGAGATRSRLHTAHVLLEHGGADIWKGDVKGGDTAVHMAVNSPTCDLSLVLLLFKHLDRKEWKKLAHAHNRSSVTPLDYARCADKSATRTNYPVEVLEFLKKCR